MYTKTGHVENHFSVGPRFMGSRAGSVHLAVILLDRFGANIPADGYSRPYVLAMGLTTSFYGFSALFLAFRIARKYFENEWAFLATIGIWLASSLPIYMYFNPPVARIFRISVSSFFGIGMHQVQRTPAQWAAWERSPA